VKKNLFTLILSLFFIDAWTQTAQDFHLRSSLTNRTGMYILGGWAISNMLTGTYGWTSQTGSKRYFHQMNTMWNVVNLSIAGYALYQLGHADPGMLSADQILQDHRRFENLFLINAGLDILYMGAGGWMIHRSGRSEKKADLLKGYGQSIILQGAFLFVFDLAMYLVQANTRLRFAPVLDTISLLTGEIKLTIPL
jgi:hypothetical protein